MVNFHTPRAVVWRHELRDRQGNVLDTDLQIEESSLDWEDERGAGGRITIAGPVPEFRNLHIQPVYGFNGVEYPLGLYRATGSPKNYGSGTRLSHQTSITEVNPLSSARTVGSVVLPPGTPVLESVRRIATEAGVELVVDDPLNDETLRSEMAFADDTAIQKDVLDPLLRTIAYRPIRRTRDGRLSTGRFVPSSERVPVFDFRNDATGIYSPEFTVNTNHLAIPNRVRGVARSSSSAPAMVAWAQDNSPDSPWSYASTGEWITASLTDVDAANPNALALLVQQELVRLQMVAAELTYQCAWVPELECGATVAFSNDRHDVSGLWEIKSMSWDSNPTSLVNITARSITA